MKTISFLLNKMGKQQDSNKKGVWWGWWVLIGIGIVYLVCVVVTPSPQINETDPVAIHTTEAALDPKRENYLEDDFYTSHPPVVTEEPEYPSEIPGVYPDALDPRFRKRQAQKLATCYAKCHSINPLYFYYNP